MPELIGIDVSHWDSVIRWSEVHAGGQVRFSIHKCTEGTTGRDDQYSNNRVGTEGWEIPWSPYHFYRPSVPPAQQASWFITNIGLPLPKLLWGDVETVIAKLLGVKPGSDQQVWHAARINANRAITAQVESWVSSIISDYKIFSDALVPYGEDGIYTSPGFWGEFFNPPPAWAANKWLWIAHVGVTKPTIPAPWNQYGEWPYNPKVKLWQYAWDGRISGIDAAVDMNKFAGVTEELIAFFGNGGQPPVPPSLPDHFHVNVAKMNIRSTPEEKSDNSNVIGTTTLGKQWQPLGISLDNQGREWWTINPRAYVAKWLTIF